MRAVIYARYSSENQRDASIEDQVRLCKERIAIESWALVQVFKDRALSGSSTLRPGYQALLEGARNGAFDVVVAEALDRLSRDQEDVAGLFKRLRFLGIEIVTLSEGKISELHVGLKGTMNALFLKDLAAKTHRGLRGRVEAGRSGGGNAFGYDVVRRPDASDDSENGARRINAAEARIVRRIFRDYGAGISPKRIALSLNAAGVPGPRGGAWNASTINGNRERGTGVINNEIYTGKLVWNRLRYVRDPESGRRRSRLNSPNDIIITSVPDLRIVPEELWAAAKARQATLEHRSRSDPASLPTPFWSKQRPRYLFSGLMRCGVCGGGFSKISSAHFGCSAARNKGPTVCANLRTIRRDELENTVLDALRERLMDPELFKEFARSFVAEWNRLQATVTADHDARRVRARPHAAADRPPGRRDRGGHASGCCTGSAGGTRGSQMRVGTGTRGAVPARAAPASQPGRGLPPEGGGTDPGAASRRWRRGTPVGAWPGRANHADPGRRPPPGRGARRAGGNPAHGAGPWICQERRRGCRYSGGANQDGCGGRI